MSAGPGPWRRWRDGGRTPLAWRNVTHNRTSMAISSAAIAFAVLIMFMELGFLNGLYDSQTALVTNFRAEIFMVSRAMHNLISNERFSQHRLEQAAAVEGVAGAYPVYIENLAAYVRHPGTGAENGIRVIGVDVDQPVFRHPQLEALVERLRMPETVLYDTTSRSLFGRMPEGTRTEVSGRRVTVAGTFELTGEYYYDGNLVAGEDTFFSLFPGQRRDRVALGLVQLGRGVPERGALARLRAAMPDDVEFLLKDEVIEREKASWRRFSPAAYIFDMGVAVGFVIGVIICYQILYTDILDHIRQLATLKAMGYQGRAIAGLVIRQGLILGALGFAPGLCLSFGMNAVLSRITGVLMRLTPGRVLFVFALTMASCVVSGALVVRKALEADPAELY